MAKSRITYRPGYQEEYYTLTSFNQEGKQIDQSANIAVTDTILEVLYFFNVLPYLIFLIHKSGNNPQLSMFQ